MILSRPDAIDWRGCQRKRVVLASGCFDLIHAGHCWLLSQAATHGKLIVGVNSDETVRKLKGEGRPINNLADRMYVLSCLKAVEVVIPFYEDTVANLIAELMPDVWVKGSDYNLETLNQEEVKAANNAETRISFITIKRGLSSTELLTKMLRT